MAYSRWGGSIWYTFNCGSDATTKEEEVFEICLVAQFTYSQLKESLDYCLNKAVELENERYKEGYQVTEEEKEELKGYMLQFLDDMEEEYKDDKNEQK